MKPNRFFWEELEPPQYQDVPIVVPNYGPPDPEWFLLREAEYYEDDSEEYYPYAEFPDEPRWRENVWAYNTDGQLITETIRVKGYVKASLDDPRYEDAPYEEILICTSFNFSRLIPA